MEPPANCRPRLIGLALATTIAWLAASVPAAPQQGSPLEMANKGKIEVRIENATPGSQIEIALNGGKIAEANVGSQGSGESVLDVANLGKTQAQIFIRVCKDGEVQLLLYTGGGAPPKDKDCDDKPLGIFWLDTTRRLTINVKGSSISVAQVGGSTPKIVAITAGGGAAATAFALRGGSSNTGNPQPGGGTNPGGATNPGGGTSTNPGGTFTLSFVVSEDQRNSAQFVLLQNVREGVIAIDGANLTMTGPAPLPTLRGTWNSSTSQVMATGAGPIAGRPSVGVRMDGTLTVGGVLNARVFVGEDGMLGPPLPHIVVYTVTGNRR